jgi:hypothetical protein
MEWIIASGPSNDDATKHVSLDRSDVFGREENTLERNENIEEHVVALLEEFYEKNPHMEKDKRFGKSKDSKSERQKNRNGKAAERKTRLHK